MKGVNEIIKFAKISIPHEIYPFCSMDAKIRLMCGRTVL